MPTYLRIAVALAGLFAIGLAGAAEDDTADSGFVPMFDGESFAGWRTTGNWVYDDDGTVTLKPREGETGW